MKKIFDRDKEINLPEIIIKHLEKINHGSLSIVVQDSKVLQMNIDENYDFDDVEKNLYGKPSNKNFKRSNENNITPSLIDEMVRIVNSIKYGYLTVTVKQGQIIEYEKNEKFRVNKT